MPVPTIVRVNPGAARTGGRQLIKVWGSNFQLAPRPPSFGVAPVPNPSVQVLFGTTPARDVKVLASSLLHVQTPIIDPGTYTVTVQNIDQDGVVIPGEVATWPGFVFGLPTIGSSDDTQQSTLTRLVATTILEFRRQVLANVVIATSTDYADPELAGANIAALAKVPALVLSGPFLRQNRFYADNKMRQTVDHDGDTYEARAPRTVDLVFTLIGVADLYERALDLMNEATAFFQRNLVISMLRDPTQTDDFVSWEIELEPDGDFKMTGSSNPSNLHTFSGTFAIRGFFIDDSDMATRILSTVNDVVATGGFVREIPPE